jgi:hypothetical protein
MVMPPTRCSQRPVGTVRVAAANAVAAEGARLLVEPGNLHGRAHARATSIVAGQPQRLHRCQPIKPTPAAADRHAEVGGCLCGVWGLGAGEGGLLKPGCEDLKELQLRECWDLRPSDLG